MQGKQNKTDYFEELIKDKLVLKPTNDVKKKANYYEKKREAKKRKEQKKKERKIELIQFTEPEKGWNNKTNQV